MAFQFPIRPGQTRVMFYCYVFISSKHHNKDKKMYTPRSSCTVYTRVKFNYGDSQFGVG